MTNDREQPDSVEPDVAAPLSDEAAIEAFDLTTDVSGRTETPQPPQVSVRVAERREGMRGILAGALVAILAATTLLGFASVGFDWASPEEARELLAVLLTPIVGLVGAATGFYFGGNAEG